MLVETRLGNLFVEVRGEGTPLLLWHSLLCEGGMWRFVVPAFAEKHRVINVDGPGHGRSAPIRRAFTLDDCADAALAILDALEVDRAHVCGLSWGAMTGMRLALAHPDRVRSLAILASSAENESRRKLPSYKLMTALARVFGAGVPLLLDRLEPIFFTAGTRAARRDVVDDFRDHVTRLDPSSIRRCVDAVIFADRDLTQRLGAIRCPTLVLVGADDTATPPARSRRIAEGIPGARYVEVPDAAHLCAIEQPERVAAEVLRLTASA